MGKAAWEQLATEDNHAERADVARKEALEKARLEAERTHLLSTRLEETEKKLAGESCEKTAIGMGLKRMQEEIQHMRKRIEATEKLASDLAIKAATAEESSRVATEKSARAELAQKAAETALEAAKTAQAQDKTIDGFINVANAAEASVDDCLSSEVRHEV